MFVDDVIIMNVGSLEEWKLIQEGIFVLCSAVGLSINDIKSAFYWSGFEREELIPFEKCFLSSSIDWNVV